MNKKLAGIFAMCALLLTGCQGAKESSKEITPPDTGWGKRWMKCLPTGIWIGTRWKFSPRPKVQPRSQ